MKQNLSEKERKQRLAAGIFFGIAALIAFLTNQSIAIVGLTGVLSVGFTLNYFTCFCGTKKIINTVRNKF